MTDSPDGTRARLLQSHQRLTTWLLHDAYPRWAVIGVEAASGGFVESVERDGSVVPRPRRLRVQARQVFAFAKAPQLGWNEPVGPLIRRGLHYMESRYQRPDGLFRTLIDADGRVLDDRALLYDQAFVLLAYAAAAIALDEPEFARRAHGLRGEMDRRLRADNGAFFSDTEHAGHWESNPHMHLLEACLAWEAHGTDREWHAWSSDIIGLMRTRFMRPDTGLLGESFDADWQPSPGVHGRIVEPGHQFEWAWLLMRAMDQHGNDLRTPALQLIDSAESFGVKAGTAVNALLDDHSVHDAGARLWPQTERLKAALSAAELTANTRYTSMSCLAAESFFPYLNGDTPGLWFDTRGADGRMLRAAAPASTLYHLVGAIMELNRTLRSEGS